MIKIAGKKNKVIQYSIGGVIGIIILFGWFSLPLVSKSSLDSAVPYGNPFQSKSINLYSLGGEIPSESGAPGDPLSGEMLNNPASSGENASSSLLHTTGEGIIWGEKDESQKSSEDSKGSASSNYSASAGIGGGGTSAPGKKLSPMSSLGGGGGGSSAGGGQAHNKFFGSGAPGADMVSVKPDTGKDKPPKVNYGGSGGAALSSLKTAGTRSLRAASSKDMDSQKSGAASAFGTNKKPGSADIATNLEESASNAGLELGEAVDDLKGNDPSLNKKSIKPPDPKPAGLTAEDRQKQAEEQIKNMFLQMLMNYALGTMFGMAGNMISGQMQQKGGMGTQQTGTYQMGTQNTAILSPGTQQSGQSSWNFGN